MRGHITSQRWTVISRELDRSAWLISLRKSFIQTDKGRAVVKQVNANSKVEICAMKGDEWIRIEGMLVLDDRVEAQESILDNYPSLRKMHTMGFDGTVPRGFPFGWKSSMRAG